MTDGERRLEAPHRRGGTSPRIVERSAVLGYRAMSWLLRSLPAKPTGAVLGLGMGAPFIACAALKSTYDLLLWGLFRNVKPRE